MSPRKSSARRRLRKMPPLQPPMPRGSPGTPAGSAVLAKWRTILHHEVLLRCACTRLTKGPQDLSATNTESHTSRIAPKSTIPLHNNASANCVESTAGSVAQDSVRAAFRKSAPTIACKPPRTRHWPFRMALRRISGSPIADTHVPEATLSRKKTHVRGPLEQKNKADRYSRTKAVGCPGQPRRTSPAAQPTPAPPSKRPSLRLEDLLRGVYSARASAVSEPCCAIVREQRRIGVGTQATRWRGVLTRTGRRTLDASVRVDVWAREVLVVHLPPRGVVREVVVKFRGSGLHLIQARSRYVREVVVFVVIANVVHDRVKPTVVRVSLVALHEHTVLGDEVVCCGVDPHAEQRSRHQVHEPLETASLKDGEVESDLHQNIHGLHLQHRFGIRENGTQCVERRLQHAPQELARR
mmetsp:Transcript_106756/g.309690  ORF Transcript_106756/g.309690 Transcript_106756/m.309690 type:complete len:411 (-) Transcript_106756:521-1753(-)